MGIGGTSGTRAECCSPAASVQTGVEWPRSRTPKGRLTMMRSIADIERERDACGQVLRRIEDIQSECPMTEWDIWQAAHDVVMAYSGELTLASMRQS